ncbi:MAG: type I-C CRISPR-associated protein Cas8c/Csd1 [Bacteroidia bacterium]|nr:type I-C CRISPR-associated protein Cas8c/Csd1 [Bacteroidia bacterium]
MILQALVEYYDRKTATGSAEVAPPGFEWKAIPFILVLNPDGSLLHIEDTRTPEGKKLVARRFLVPQDVGRTSAIDPNLLWDKAEYALSVDIKGNPTKTHLQFEAFRQRIATELAGVAHDEGVLAVLRFLENPNWQSATPHLVHEIVETNANVSFRLAGDSADLVSLRPAVVAAIQSNGDTQVSSTGVCLVTGQVEPTERLHPSIKGVWGSQSSGANIVSFNLPAFTSYGKEQGANAPVGASAVFKYTTALNLLLDKKSNQRMQVGDASTVFWSKQGSALEGNFASLFAEPEKDNPDARTTAIRSLLGSIQNGAYVADDGNDTFYVLGLSPNASRIAIRFWHVGTVAQTGTRIAGWFDDLDMVGRDKFGYPSLFRLLTSIATLGKAENIPPNLAGDTLRTVLAGLPLPETLLQAAVRRNQAEQKATYPRAALIKAYLNRRLRFSRSPNPRFPVALDPEHPNIGYQLGRLFAVIEKTQVEASMGDTLKSFYSAASSTPQAVFATLIARHRHHVDKLEKQGRTGQAVNRRKLVAQIASQFQGTFPARLSLADQGAFAIGYYHQQQDFYPTKATEPTTSTPEAV